MHPAHRLLPLDATHSQTQQLHRPHISAALCPALWHRFARRRLRQRFAAGPLDGDPPTSGGLADSSLTGRGEEPGTPPPQHRPTGYTPFEYVSFTEDQLVHEVSAEVEAPIAATYQAWRQRENYGEWFDLIGQTILHDDDDRLASYFLFYQWGNLPALELYTTLCRQEEVEHEKLQEVAVDGMFLAVGAHFDRLSDSRTRVTLRLGYLMPANLGWYVGAVGLWGDINDLLLDGMDKMKEHIEGGAK